MLLIRLKKWLNGSKKDKIIGKLIENIKKFKVAHKFEKVILFGSYARGDYKRDSDVDIIIIDGKFKGQSVFERSKGLWIYWHIKQKVGLPVDFLCYSPEEFNRERKKVSIVSEALREGIEI